MSHRPPKPTVTRRPRGTGTVTPVWQGGAWRFRARFPDGAGGMHNVGTVRAEDAAHAALNALVEARRETQFRGAASSLRAYGERWVEKAGGRNIGPWRSVWRTTVCAAEFADWPLDAITMPDVRDWARALPEHISERGTPISRDTAKHALGRLRLCLQEAVEDGLIPTNPAADVSLPDTFVATPEPWTFLTIEEIGQVLEHPDLSAKARSAFAVAIYQGLRQGELAALSWERVRLTGPRPGIDVLASWDGETKTKTSRRDVPLTPMGQAALLAWWEGQGRPKAGPVWPSRPRRKGAKPGHHARGYDWGWAPQTDRARGLTLLGWRYRVGLRRRVRFHDLRHTCASALVSGYWGDPWPLTDVAKFLGHSHEAVTERYAHLDPRALSNRAARTCLQPVRAVDPQVAQLLEIIGQAVGDSNARPLAPEGKANLVIPGSYGGADRSRTGSLLVVAQELLERCAQREKFTREDADLISKAVLLSEPVLLAGRLVEAPEAEVHSLTVRLLEAIVRHELGRAPATERGAREGAA